MKLIAYIIGFAVLTACNPASKSNTDFTLESHSDHNIESAQLIPRKLIFGNPVKAQARISPDGKWISWLAPSDGVLNIWIASSDDPNSGRVLTRETGRSISNHNWSLTSQYILFENDKNGDENTHVFSVHIETGKLRDLTPAPDGVAAEIVAKSWTSPNEIIVAMNERDRSLFDLYRVSIETGARRLVQQNNGYSAWVIDRKLEPKFGIVEPETGGALVVDFSGRTILSIPIDDYINSYVVGMDFDGGEIYLIDSRNRDKAALTRHNIVSGNLEVIAEGDAGDIDNVFFHPVTSEPLAVAENYLKSEWKILSPKIANDFDYLREELPGLLKVVSKSRDMETWIVYAESPEQPGTYYIYKRTTQSLTELFKKRPDLKRYHLQPMQALTLQSRDGLPLVSYLTLPPGSDTNGDGRPEKPVPMVLNVHGGPWSRDEYRYEAYAQWLSNRGYAVLSVNYRGSLGFGKDFMNAGIREFSGKMHDDLIDGVNWAIHEGIAAPDKVAIMGGSYGGYATLIGLSFTPDVFACGVDRVGMSNLVTLIESFPDYTKPFLESDWYLFVGNPSIPEERNDMLARSPISRASAITAPLLITQGENDPRVTKKESDQIVALLAEAGRRVTYLNFPDEGHGIRGESNRYANFAVTEAFLTECLAGRSEPIGNALQGSSIEVLHGREYVRGLIQALSKQGQEN